MDNFVITTSFYEVLGFGLSVVGFCFLLTLLVLEIRSRYE